MRMAAVEWGGLDCLVVHDLPADTLPALAVILCHGFGAPGTDLVGLAEGRGGGSISKR
jgi:phospholipase/carboxylesterase